MTFTISFDALKTALEGRIRLSNLKMFPHLKVQRTIRNFKSMSFSEGTGQLLFSNTEVFFTAELNAEMNTIENRRGRN